MAAPANVLTVSDSASTQGDFTRLLGAAPVAVSAAVVPVVESNRFRLLGVLAPVPAVGSARPSTFGVALIAVDGKPARPYAVGARLDGDMVLQSISRRSASIGLAQGEPGIVLELPLPAAPATGVLPRAVSEGSAPPPRAAPAAPRPPPPQAQFQQPPPMQPPAEEVVEDESSDGQPRAGGVPGRLTR